MKRYTNVVIGSGPCGYAAALALVRAGHDVAILDFGESPDVERTELRGSSTIALKGEGARARVFDYPSSLVVGKDSKHLPLSSARGGLSNIWGAGILARSRADCPELEPVFDGVEAGYRALFAELSVIGCDDELSKRFPWPTTSAAGPSSTRYSDLLTEVSRGLPSDVLAGHARAAIDAAGERCVRCGLCLHGCPRDLFFSAGSAVRELAESGSCSLITGPVTRLVPSEHAVVLELAVGEILAKRVILALGPVATPALLQRSGLVPNDLLVRDSAVFYTALLNSWRSSGDEWDFTAAQAALYSARPGADDFQLSLYESNPEYAERLAGLLPFLGGLLRPPEMLTQRLNAGIGFLDSSVSGNLRLRFVGGQTIVDRVAARGTWGVARSVMRRVSDRLSGLGIRPVPGAILVPPPGSGYHSGASLPMGGDIVGFDGALHSSPRVYVADASSLPKVWAGSHTFTAMANAHRIASSIRCD